MTAGTYEPRLGIDIGRVIIGGPEKRSSDTSFFDGDDAALLSTPEVPGASEAIERLVPLFGGRVWLISKCGQRIQDRTLLWMTEHKFYERTGVHASSTIFCRRREEKRMICIGLKLTHFVDDRRDVHAAINEAVRHQYLFGPQNHPGPACTITVPDWVTAEQLITNTLIRERA
jgi:hypothetical protein